MTRNSLCHSWDELLGLIALGQAFNNPKSSVALNEWMDEKLDNRMEAFTSVNRILKDMLDKAETKLSMLQEQNAKAALELKDLEIKHEREITSYKLELQNAKHQAEKAIWELKTRQSPP